MDRVTQLRGQPGGSRDSTLNSTSTPSEAYLTANDTSKYFSLTENSSFDVKDVSLATAAAESTDSTLTDPDQLISNLSPISKNNDLLDSFKIGKPTEAANILSGGVDIFEDNDNSYDGDELVIDDNPGLDLDEKSNSEVKLGKESQSQATEDSMIESTLVDGETAIASKDTEVVLQIDGKNVDAIEIGNGLFLYRKDNEMEELSAVQIVDTDQQQPSFKFLKVKSNDEGNLEVYEEIEVEVPDEGPFKREKSKNTSHLPIKGISKVMADPSSKAIEKKKLLPNEEPKAGTSTVTKNPESEISKVQVDSKGEVNINGKTMKFNEAKKSPVIGSFTPMTYHSTPIKEGIPLTKTMVDMQLHPNRHSDNAKKTIEVNTESCKQKLPDTLTKNDYCKGKNVAEMNSSDKIEECLDIMLIEKETSVVENKILEAEPFFVGDGDEAHKNNFNNKSTGGAATTSSKAMGLASDIEASSNTEQKYEKTGNEVTENSSHDSNKIPTILDNKSSQEDISAVKPAEEIPTKSEADQKNMKGTTTNKKTKSEYIVAENKITELEKEIITEKVPVCLEQNLMNDEQTSKECKNKNISVDEIAKQITMSEKKGPPIFDEVEVNASSVKETIYKDKTLNKSNIRIKEGYINTKTTSELIETKKSLPAPVSSMFKSTISAREAKTPNLHMCLEKDHNNDSSTKSTNQDSGTGSKNCCNELIELNDLGIEVIKDKVSELFPDAIKTDLKNISPNYNRSEPASKSETASTIAKVEAVANKFGYSKADEPKPSSIKMETKSTVTTNDFINKYVNKALIIKSSPNSTFDDGKNNEGTNSKQNITKLNTETLSNKTFGKTDPISVTVDKKDIPRVNALIDTNPKSINNNAVPFGKWTEANKQEYLIKIKETKVASNNTNQIKQTNDLNRRDVLKKFDSQRQINSIAAAAKTQELANVNKQNIKTEKPSFISKASLKQDIKMPVKSEATGSKDKTKLLVPNTSSATVTKQEPTAPAPAVINLPTEPEPQYSTQSLIDRTIEDILMDRRPPPKFNHESALRQNPLAGKSMATNDKTVASSATKTLSSKDKKVMPLDDIEMKMNELHGIPFIERPVHELPLPPRYNKDVKTYSREGHSKILPMSKVNKIPPLVPLPNKPQALKTIKSNDMEDLSDEEIIEHEPITGDIDLQKRKITLPQQTARLPISQTVTSLQTSLKDDNGITENEFDKFARRNSKTYENCITVNFESNKHHNVVQGIVEKEFAGAKNAKSLLHYEVNSQHRRHLPNMHPNKPQTHGSRFLPINTEEEFNKNYQSKLQIAYQSAMTAKKHKESSITVIEDKPVKVVFMDGNSEYVPAKLNVQCQELSPTKKYSEPDAVTLSSCDSLDAEVIETVDELKTQDSTKKTKHQRKQVLTPVETPEMELIEPNKFAQEASPKKKRKIEDYSEKTSKNVLPKKSYLLGRGDTNEIEPFSNPPREHISRREHTTASAIDSLVKAAELLEKNQSENLNESGDSQNSQQTPMKRGRGRPRKYPLPEGTVEKTKAPSPLKKPRLERKSFKPETSSDEETTDEEMVRENWTMGKINENIVCPICKKLFRSENVVFKHVKHCTGPSPSRSDSGDKRSPRRSRISQDPSYKSSCDSQSEEMDSDSDKSEDIPLSKQVVYKDKKDKQVGKPSEDVIAIEDTPKPKRRVSEKRDHAATKCNDTRKTLSKVKKFLKQNDLSCEICGKTFRQLSYLASHRMQHNNDGPKRSDTQSASKSSVFSCEVCKKEFRKLHHLVQHRLIHNPPNLPSKLRRKSSAEQTECKSTADSANKTTEDQSTGFRCEPCDKSFRKLHHLVEHRETHDGINRQKNSSSEKTTSNIVDKTDAAPPQCDICGKTFRKLHHLIEHKEQHVENSLEKTEYKSNKNALSTKDIIHECSLCYMVFPNEHSLNKHTVNCLKKKRQSASKQTKKPETEDQTSQDSTDSVEIEDHTPKEAILHNSLEKDDRKEEVAADNIPKRKKSDAILELKQKLDTAIPKRKKSDALLEQKQKPDTVTEHKNKPDSVLEVKNKADATLKLNVERDDKPPENMEVTALITKVQATVKDIKTVVESSPVTKDIKEPQTEAIPPSAARSIKTKKPVITETIGIKNTPKKNIAVKDKATGSVTKRLKTTHLPLSNIDEDKIASDDDDIRYMLNPDFNSDEATGENLFMNIRANKRNSLQIERPNSKDPIKRRISLQYHSKLPRLKSKVDVQSTLMKSKAIIKEIVAKPPAIDPVPSTDSDDSDVKYSFPKPAPEKLPAPASKHESPKETANKTVTKTLATRRKSLTSIAKRKSTGKLIMPRQKPKAATTTQVKKRTTEVGHRCDCGQLFNSAALLSRHTSLAHTPPRIRRRRSPASSPEKIKKPRTIINARRVTKPSKPVDIRKSSVKSDTSTSKATNSQKSNVKSVVGKAGIKPKVNPSGKAPKTPRADASKTEIANTAKSGVKLRRSAAHSGVPVPEKMRKITEKLSK